ncbi:MAG: hypothetical protein ACYSW7_02805 [Planctomycetota bacterium]
MPHNIRIVSSYPPRKCGVGTHIKFVSEEIELVTGRAEKLTREKTSIYQSNLTDFYA